jgi:F0F1-type ATP synthase membrane subunit c/vacuolar-type H+-ATPase subunit K
MVANHLLTGVTFGLSLSIASWMAGIIGGALLQRTSIPP